ncbi:hypothetical protein B0J18DRAFT_455786 [Chaetomium sp. MPI-SDFR-AT-0129]|nr:hypothetical protein B0J18DRAFT_455786 [Chaetomium sp. MPI-SDFR-AT-0129]
MQLTALSLLASVASVSAAALTPKDTNELFENKFTLVAERRGAPFDGQFVTASKSSLRLLVPSEKRDAQCTKGSGDQPAVLIRKHHELFLYNSDEDFPQQLAVNTLAENPNNLKYFSHLNNVPDHGNWETMGWDIGRQSRIQFYDRPWVACQEPDGTYKVGVAWKKTIDSSCLTIRLLPEHQYYATKCQYSEE